MATPIWEVARSRFAGVVVAFLLVNALVLSVGLLSVSAVGDPDPRCKAVTFVGDGSISGEATPSFYYKGDPVYLHPPWETVKQLCGARMYELDTVFQNITDTTGAYTADGYLVDVKYRVEGENLTEVVPERRGALMEVYGRMAVRQWVATQNVTVIAEEPPTLSTEYGEVTILAVRIPAEET